MALLNQKEIEEKISYINDLAKEFSKIKPNWSILGYIVYKRTYARAMYKVYRNNGWTKWLYAEDLKREEVINKNKLVQNGEMFERTEEYFETIQRCLISLVRDVKVPYSNDELRRMYDYHMRFVCNLAGRQLWQLGSKLVKQGYADSLYNCYFFAMDSKTSFLQIFEELMLGGGCGFGIQKRFISKLPQIKDCNIELDNSIEKEKLLQTNEKGYFLDNLFVTGDSRQGWVNLLNNILTSFFETGKSFKFNTNLIRPEGEPIVGFGGVSSGDKELIKGMNNIISILKNAVGRQLKSVEILDIVCNIASIVVSGNVRRSALLALGDSDDEEFLVCKRWDLGNVDWVRSFVNISIETDNNLDLDKLFYDTYKKDCEPMGIVNMENMKRFGRLGKNKLSDGKYYDNAIFDGEVEGTNPCSEISLQSESGCLLSEIVLSNINDYETFIDAVKLIYKACKHISQMNFLYENTQKKTNKSSRIGISITGVMDNIDFYLKYADRAYNELREFDIEYSKKNNFPKSIKLTTHQPSGTKSLLSGASHGLHPVYSKYYYRTIRFAKNNPLLKLCEEAGFKIEDSQFLLGFETPLSKYKNPIIKPINKMLTPFFKLTGKIKKNISTNPETKVVYFPCKANDNAILAKDVNSIKQLEYVKLAQELWSDNSTSVTVYYTKRNIKKIFKWVKKNIHDIKTISLLPFTHGFLQAPYIEINEKEYLNALKNVKEIDYSSIQLSEMELDDNLECSSGHCPVR